MRWQVLCVERGTSHYANTERRISSHNTRPMEAPLASRISSFIPAAGCSRHEFREKSRLNSVKSYPHTYQTISIKSYNFMHQTISTIGLLSPLLSRYPIPPLLSPVFVTGFFYPIGLKRSNTNRTTAPTQTYSHKTPRNSLLSSQTCERPTSV